MRKGFVGAAVVAAAVAAAVAPAGAQEVRLGANDLRGKQARDLLIGFGAVGVLPTNGGRVGVIGGEPQASNSASPQLDVTYFATRNIALNLIAATTRHDVEVKNSALGRVDLGRVWALPPTLTLQYHPFPQARFSPYLGVGLNVTFFYGYSGERTPPVTRVRLENSVGVAGNVGFDYEITPRWLANFDVKYIMMQPDVSVNSGFVRGRADINPVVVSAALRYRFSL